MRNFPDALLTCSPTEVHQVISTPCVIELTADHVLHEQPLVLSVLLHGNETSSLFILQKLLEDVRHSRFPMPRPLFIIIGNVDAASKGVRHLSHQPDFNRIWNSTELGEHFAWARGVLELMKERRPFACLDLHNNTGRNPHYSCVSSLDPRSIGMAQIFSNTVIYSRHPHSTLESVTSEICPSATLECGLPGSPEGIQHGYETVLTVWHLDRIHEMPFDSPTVNVYESQARMLVKPETRICFDSEPNLEADVTFDDELDLLNFLELKAGTFLGWGKPSVLRAMDGSNDRTSEYFHTTPDGEIRTRKGFVPAMLTKVPDIIFQDCLGYIMEPVKHPTIRSDKPFAERSA